MGEYIWVVSYSLISGCSMKIQPIKQWLRGKKKNKHEILIK